MAIGCTVGFKIFGHGILEKKSAACLLFILVFVCLNGCIVMHKAQWRDTKCWNKCSLMMSNLCFLKFPLLYCCCMWIHYESLIHINQIRIGCRYWNECVSNFRCTKKCNDQWHKELQICLQQGLYISILHASILMEVLNCFYLRLFCILDYCIFSSLAFE